MYVASNVTMESKLSVSSLVVLDQHVTKHPLKSGSGVQRLSPNFRPGGSWKIHEKVVLIRTRRGSHRIKHFLFKRLPTFVIPN